MDTESTLKDTRHELIVAIANYGYNTQVMKAAEAGDISGDYGYVYPPGIPFIVPGEVVTKEILCDIINAKVSGYELHGVDFKDDVPYMNFVQDCITREHN